MKTEFGQVICIEPAISQRVGVALALITFLHNLDALMKMLPVFFTGLHNSLEVYPGKAEWSSYEVFDLGDLSSRLIASR